MANELITKRTVFITAALLTLTFSMHALSQLKQSQSKEGAGISKETIVMNQYTTWFFVPEAYRSVDPHNTDHFKNYSQYLSDKAPYNGQVLKGMDKVMATAPDGGTYYIGKDNPTPVGYNLEFNSYSLLTPHRKSSYCSGATYAAFIEAMNLIDSNYRAKMTDDQLDAMRMQEKDGKDRPDNVKMWGYWNNDFWGVYDSTARYSSIGEAVPPYDALPGDFVKIMWSKTSGHFVIFLGWVKGEGNVPTAIRYWSSNPGTNGFGEQESSLSKVYSLLHVRLKHPGEIVNIEPDKTVTPLSVDDAGYVLK